MGDDDHIQLCKIDMPLQTAETAIAAVQHDMEAVDSQQVTAARAIGRRIGRMTAQNC